MSYLKSWRFWILILLFGFVSAFFIHDFICADVLSDFLFEYRGPDGDYDLSDDRIAGIVSAINLSRDRINKKDGGEHFGKYQERMMKYLNGERPLRIYWSEYMTSNEKRPLWVSLLFKGTCGMAFMLTERIVLGPGTFDVCTSSSKTVTHEMLHLAIGAPGHSKLIPLVDFYFPDHI
ncbi:MAG: hypothetical protein WD898_00915 [Candidatus Paceibacterota bacterium]